MSAVKPWLAALRLRRPARPSSRIRTRRCSTTCAALAAEHGDKPALLFKGATVSYARLEAESDAFGAALVAMGVRKGDRVALLLPNCPQFLVAEFGVWKAGGIVVALNPTYSERELEQALDSTRSSAGGRADAVLRARQARAGPHRGAHGHPDLDQGIPADAAAAAVHAAEGEEGRPSHHAAGGRPVDVGAAACRTAASGRR